jgi:hypothetical protein
MNTLQSAPAGEQTFAQFLFHNRRNRIILCLVAAAIIIQFVVFKYLYPFASYIHDDSFYYIDTAYKNLTVSGYPIGYSKFLRLVSVFAKPDWGLVSLQYLLIQCSALFFLFTLFYFYKAGRVTQAILVCFMVFNPLFLHMGNMVSSDGLFLALSMTWFALLIWIIYKPSNTVIFWHALAMFTAFIVRYNALIYPFIAALAFGLSKLSLRKKLAGLGLGLLLCGWFIALTMFQFKKLTGYWQFSPFSGWQVANNAMYAYRKVDSAAREPVPPQFRKLDKMVRSLFDRYPNLPVGEASTYFMWAPSLPLMRYKEKVFQGKDSAASEFKQWASMGPLYSAYGWCIIKKYPLHFLRYFVGPNTLKYFFPPVEYLEDYNRGQPTVLESAVTWFGYKNNQVKTNMQSSKVWVLQYYPYLVCFSNLILFLMLLSYLLLKGWQFNASSKKIIILAGFVWLANAGFIIVVAPVALRFQAFPALLSISFCLLLIDWMARLIQSMKLQDQQQKPGLAI